MAESRNRQFAKLAKDITSAGDIKESGISSDVNLGGATIYATRSSLPSSGNTAGDQAFVTGNSRLYIWNGSGWYNVALLNLAPSITSVLDSDSGTTPFTLSTTGAVTRITITATDSDGDPLTYESSADSDFSGLATLSQSSNVFTITPLSEDSATTTSGTITFTATDGINTASSGVQTFTLSFVSALWDEVLMSIEASGNNVGTRTFTDKSSNSYTLTPVYDTQNIIQGGFNPYLDNWSTYFGLDDNSSVVFGNLSAGDELGTGAFTIEAWIYPLNITNNGGIINYGTYTAGLMLRVGSSAQLYYNSTGQNLTMPSLNEWSHICLERDGSNNWAWYINGVSQNTWTSSTSITGSGNALQIGRNNHSASEDFYGWISNVRVVKGSRVYGSAFTPPTSKLTAVSGTTFLGMQDNRWKDNSSSARAVSAVNAGCKISSLNPFGQGSEYASGENKGSVYLRAQTTSNRIGTNFSMNDVMDNGTSDLTIEYWAYNVKYDTNGNFVLSSGANGSDAQRLAMGTLSSDGTVGVGFTGSSVYGASIGLYQWYHAAVVIDASTKVCEFFLNGVSEGTFTATGGVGSTTNFTIGGLYTLNSYDHEGYISDIKITKSKKYTTDFTPPTSPLGTTSAEFYLPFDNAGVYDKTGNNQISCNSSTTVSSTSQTKYATSSIYLPGGTGSGIHSRFDYSNNQWSTASSLGLRPALTMEGWFYPVSDASNDNVLMAFGTGSESVARGFMLQAYSTSAGGYRFWLTNNGSSWNLKTDTDVGIARWTGSWKHIAITRTSAGVWRFFVNGTQTHTFTSDTDVGMSNGNYEVFIGMDNSTTNNHSAMYVEDFQLLNYAKYTSNFTPPTQKQGRRYQLTS